MCSVRRLVQMSNRQHFDKIGYIIITERINFETLFSCYCDGTVYLMKDRFDALDVRY